jgi:hypothetical protein
MTEVGRGRIGRVGGELGDMRGWVEVWDWEEGGGVSGKGSGLGVPDERSGMEPNELLLSRGLPVPWKAGAGCGSGISLPSAG